MQKIKDGKKRKKGTEKKMQKEDTKTHKKYARKDAKRYDTGKPRYQCNGFQGDF